MNTNGSPPAIFETDSKCHYFLTVLPIHPEATRKTTTLSQDVEQTHQFTSVLPNKTLPTDLQILINNLNIRPSKEDLRLVIQKLCSWQPLTAQQLVKLLKRKDKKHRKKLPYSNG
jgi:hypothetical protein